ncbi:MAG: NADH-ubiquinone oxidoreductase-F iron-sulfur binding region domain-containing protein [Nitrospirota bacterium]
MTEEKELKVEDIKNAAEARSCAVQKALAYITGFLAGPMCGRCFPCAFGSYEARIRLQQIAEGRGSEEDLAALKRIAADMAEASMCKKGKDTAKFILEWMEKGAFAEHGAGRCSAGECSVLVEYRVAPDDCIMCNACKEVCKYSAIVGEKRKPYFNNYPAYEIRQKRCTRCGECITVCPTGAIVKGTVGAGEPAAV